MYAIVWPDLLGPPVKQRSIIVRPILAKTEVRALVHRLPTLVTALPVGRM